MPVRWNVDYVADRLIRDLQKEIGMAQSFFHEASVLVLVFGLLDSWVNGKLTRPLGWFIVAVSVTSYVLALLTEWIARWLFRTWAYSTLLVKEVAGGKRR